MKIDSGLVKALSVDQYAYALVRVRNPLHLGYIEKRFNVVASFPFIRSLGIRCNKSEVQRLASMQEVEFIAAQGKVSALDDGATNGSAGRNNLTSSDAGNAANLSSVAESFSAQGLTGAGVTMCVMDTGISPHSDLSIPVDRIVLFKDLINHRSHPYDDNGHGTFVTGVAAGNGLLSAEKIKGVAPDAKIVGLKVISASGETGAFTILDGMQWLYENHKKYNIKVVCMSFGADPVATADPLKLGVEILSRSGLTVVCSAGNSGENALKSPGISSEVITVGAVDENLEIAPFSSSGYYHGIFRPDIYAPGVKVRGLSAGATYGTMTGTSVSAPYIAGACCLLHQKYKHLSPYDAKHMLMSSAKIVGGAKVFTLD